MGSRGNCLHSNPEQALPQAKPYSTVAKFLHAQNEQDSGLQPNKAYDELWDGTLCSAHSKHKCFLSNYLTCLLKSNLQTDCLDSTSLRRLYICSFLTSSTSTHSLGCCGLLSRKVHTGDRKFEPGVVAQDWKCDTQEAEIRGLSAARVRSSLNYNGVEGEEGALKHPLHSGCSVLLLFTAKAFIWMHWTQHQ